MSETDSSAKNDSASGQAARPRTAGRPVRKSAVRNAPDLVFEGLEGHFFLKGDTNKAHEQHLGRLVMTDELAARWREIMLRRQLWIERMGSDFVFLIGPDKQSVLWNMTGEAGPDHRNSHYVFNSELRDVNWVDPVVALQEAGLSDQVYPFTDSHWDQRGAYFAYREVVGAVPSLGEPLVEGKNFTFSAIDAQGDLGNKFVPPKTSEQYRLKKLSMTSRFIYNNGIAGNGGLRVHYNRKAENVGFLCGDSYSQHLFPYFAEHFRFLVHLRSPVDRMLIEEAKPSCVIGSVAERFMLQPPVNDDDVPMEMLFITKLVRSAVTPGELEKGRTPFAGEVEVPTVIQRMFDRHDAIADVLLADGPTATQAKFREPMYDGASAADILVAKYISWTYREVLHESWADAYQGLSPKIRRTFEDVCPSE